MDYTDKLAELADTPVVAAVKADIEAGYTWSADPFHDAAALVSPEARTAIVLYLGDDLDFETADWWMERHSM